MAITGPSLKVTAETTAADLKHFVDTASSKGRTKLVAEKVDGETFLYFKSDKRSSLSDRVSGVARERRELAYKTLQTIADKVTNSLEGKLSKVDDDHAVQDYLKEHYDRDFDHEIGSAIRVGDVQELARSLALFETISDYLSVPPPKESPPPKRLEDLGHLMVDKGEEMPVETNYGEVSLPTFVLEGKTYKPVKQIADSPVAMIVRYDTDDKPPKSLVIKVPLPTADKELVADMEAEAIRHGEVAGDGKDPNLLQMRGAMRLGDGKPAIILDFAPNGNLFDFGQNIRRMTGDGEGQIPSELGVLMGGALVGDAAKGLKALHDKGYVHNDFKDVNVMIDDKGRAVVMDFGETDTLEGTKSHRLKNENSAYASRGLLAIVSDKKNIPKMINEQKNYLNSILSEQLDGFSFLSPALIGEIKEKLSEAIEKKTGEFENIAHKTSSENSGFNAVENDLWGLGGISLGAFSGRQIGEGEFNSDVKKRVLNQTEVFGERTDYIEITINKEAKVVNRIKDGTLIEKTGDLRIDGLLYNQFARKPEDRPTLDEVIGHPLMKRPGVDQQPLRDFIVVVQQMGRYDTAIEMAQKRIDDVTSNARKAGKDISETGLSEIAVAKMEIEAMNEKKTLLLPTFEEKKELAMIVLRESGKKPVSN